jgi:translation initiation factor IF-1
VGLPQRAEGVITGVNARGEFRVKLVNGQLVHATMCEELHEWFVRLLPGDKVEVDLENPHGKRGVIVDRRLPEGRSLLAALRSRASGAPFPPSLDS